MKTTVILIATAALIIIFVTPVRDGLNNLLLKNKNKIGGENKETKLSDDFRSEINDSDQKLEIQDKIMNYRLKSRERIKQIQTALRNAGFYKGKIDGLTGPETKKATRAFQKSKGLHPDGVVGTRTWEKLREYLTF